MAQSVKYRCLGQYETHLFDYDTGRCIRCNKLDRLLSPKHLTSSTHLHLVHRKEEN